MKSLIGALCIVGLAACGSPDTEEADFELGLDEGAACPDPGWYCLKQHGYGWLPSNAAKDYSQWTGWAGYSSGAYFTVEAGIKRVTLKTSTIQYPDRSNVSCPEFWRGMENGTEWTWSRVTNNKCRTFFSRDDGEDLYTDTHQHLVATSNCLGYVECYQQFHRP